MKIVYLGLVLCGGVMLFVQGVSANNEVDRQAVVRAARDYIESQHIVSEDMMRRDLHSKLVKRTYWRNADGTEFVMETDYDKEPLS